MMGRRTYTAFFFLLLAGLATAPADAPNSGGPNFSGCEPLAENVTTLSNGQQINVVTCDSIQNETGAEKAGYAYSGNDTVFIREEYLDDYGEEILVHEVGHVLGYDHNDGGVMADPYDRPKCSVHPTTVEIVNNMTGASIVEDGYCETVITENIV